MLGDYGYGYRNYQSDYFSTKNYKILLQQLSGTFSYQPSSSTRFSLIPKYTEKINKSGIEKSEAAEISIEFQKSVTEGGNALIKLTRNEIKYNGAALSPVSYEMLEGLVAGSNYLWTVQIIKSLNKSLQMSLNYTGRNAQGAKTVHTGTVEFRAFF